MNQSCSMRGRSDNTTHTYTKITAVLQLWENPHKSYIHDIPLYVTQGSGFFYWRNLCFEIFGGFPEFLWFFFSWIFLPQPVITIATAPMCWCHLSSCLNLIIADPCERLWGLVCSVYQDHSTFARFWKKKLLKIKCHLQWL